MAEGSSSHKRGLLKTLVVILFMYLHTRDVELLYKRNITRVDMRYGCVSALVITFSQCYEIYIFLITNKPENTSQ